MKQKLLQFTHYFVIPLSGMITLLSLLILLVSLPAVWHPLYDSAMPDKMHALYRSDAKKISDGFWQDKSYAEINLGLNATKFKIKSLSLKEIKHFEDVKKLVHFFFYPAILGTLLLLTWKFVLKKPIRWYFSLGYLCIIGGSFAIWGLIAWRHMFRSLHWWIFQDDSWILPKNSYTLHLFPYSVWQLASLIVMGTLTTLLVCFSMPAVIKAIKHLKNKQKA